MKVLHLSFHKGCINDMDYICKQLNVECEVLSHVAEWNTNKSLQTLAEYSNQHYNITHALADKYWNRYKDYFDQFDCIITSDTAPLSRIFLQNNWNKKLIIWICNRFDYSHRDAYSPPDFPDHEYYDLFRKATTMPNVKIFGYTLFENIYCKAGGIDIKDNIMRPCGCAINIDETFIEKPEFKDTLFVVPYHNETIMMNLQEHLQSLNIKAISSRYDGARDLSNYKAVIHIPYAIGNIALFEAFQVGLVYFVPSFQFLLKLFATYPNHWLQNKEAVLSHPEYMEWYKPDFQNLFIYFDSWEDLVSKYNTLDYVQQKNTVLSYGKTHAETCVNKWREAIFS